jgi:multidrug efflux pump subunit AcrB
MGQQKRAKKSTDSMQYMMGIVLFLMMLILSLNFNSAYQGFLIIMVIPVGVFGAMLGHGIEGLPVSTLSAWGIIALMGILVNDAVVYLDSFNRNLRDGQNIFTAIYNAGISRFRPIVLTSVTTVAGLYPLILETSFQAQFLIPMGISVAYGVLFGTFFLLLFLPALVLTMNDVKRTFKWFWTGVKPSKLEVEPTLIDIRRLKEIDKV